jgi:hypothetical protein
MQELDSVVIAVFCSSFMAMSLCRLQRRNEERTGKRIVLQFWLAFEGFPNCRPLLDLPLPHLI